MAQDEASKKSHENMMFRIAGQVAQQFLKINPAFIFDLFKRFDENMPKPGKETWAAWVQDLVEDKRCDQDTADLLKEGFDMYPFPVNLIYYISIILKVHRTQTEKAMEVFALDRQYDNLAQTTPHPAPVDNLVRSMIIDPARSTENRAELKKHGFSDLQIDNIILSYYRTVEEGTIRTNFLRKNIDEKIMFERMRELGYTDTRIKEIVQTWIVLPGPGDLFEMVAKEAFEPDIYTKLGLASEFPTEQVKWLEQQGISRAWAEKYWIAHWNQPSIGQGFEMLHRGVISPDELDLLFRAVEIPSFWRDKLTAIAYSPYTRVDVRRMHDLGVVTDAELIISYMDIGYSPEKALKMANFTIAFNASHEKELTRGAILESYQEGLITKTDATKLLTAQDYSADLADYYLTLSDYNRDKKTGSLLIENIRDNFLLSITTETQARAALNALGLLGDKTDALIDGWKLDLYKYQHIPTKSELDRFLVKGIITEAQWVSLMARHGFSSVHIAWFLQDMKVEREAPGRPLNRTVLKEFYKKKVVDETTWRTEMSLLNYSDKHINWYFKAL